MRYKDTIWYRISLYGLEILGKYYGSYRAYVYNNEDPLDMNRVQLIIPMLNPTAVDETWAFPKNSWGGKDYGINLLPRKTDMVWVEFQNGDPDYPVWSHASYAKDEKPKEFETVEHYGFKTPGGSLIVINDNPESEEILVKLNNQAEWIKINKEILEVEAKVIKLGTNGDEAAVMGDTLLKRLETLTDKIDTTYDILIKHKHLSPNTPPTPDDVLLFNKVKQDVKKLKGELPGILSKKVKIDK